MIKDPKKTVSLVLPQEIYDKVKRLAKEDCRSVPSYLRMMLYNHLRGLETAPQDNS